MKLKLFLIASVCLGSIHAGRAQSTHPEMNMLQQANLGEWSGNWEFKQVEWIAYRHGGTRSNPIESKLITQTDSLDAAGFPFERVFHSMEISGGEVVCTLGSRYGYNRYRLNDNQLNLLEEKKEKWTENEDGELPESIIPLLPYSFLVSGNTLQISYTYPFGDSRYKFSLEGAMTITFVNQSDKQSVIHAPDR
jgi:hypothetical protein